MKSLNEKAWIFAKNSITYVFLFGLPNIYIPAKSFQNLDL